MRKFCYFVALSLPVIGAGANTGLDHAPAPVMPEARRFLSDAQKSLDAGQYEFAGAVAGAVLIADEVSVNVNLDQVPKGQRADCMKAMTDALATWQSAMGNELKFRMEPDVAKADVRLSYQPEVRMDADAVAGLTTWKRSIHAIRGGHVTLCSIKTEVQVRTQDLRYHPMSLATLRQATMHEFGHVLGLEDSPHVGDLMGELDPRHPVTGPTDKEVASVRAIRQEAKEIKTAADTKAHLPVGSAS